MQIKKKNTFKIMKFGVDLYDKLAILNTNILEKEGRIE